MQKIAVVTGGIRGIGAAISQELKAKNYLVIANYCARHEVAEAFSATHNIPVMAWDATDYSQCQQAVEQIEQDHGPINILINNAGITKDAMLHKMPVENWQKVIDVNLTSCFNMCHAVINQMRQQNYGRIVNISSINAQAGQLGQTNYCASKAGILGFTKALARESANKNITVNAVCPGYIETEMTQDIPEKIYQQLVAQIPVGRFGKPEEIARAVSFLVEDSGFITGESLSVNGGHYMA